MFRWFSKLVSDRSPKSAKRASFCLGVIGVGSLSIAAAIVGMIIATVLDDPSVSEWESTVLPFAVCTVYGTMSAAFTTASFIPMMVASRLTIRFLFAQAMGVLLYCAVVAMLVATESVSVDNLDKSDFVSTGSMAACVIIGISTVALMVRFKSSLTLTPWHPGEYVTRRTSILDLMELVGLAALIITSFRIADVGSDMAIQLVSVACVGIFLGILSSSLCAGFFSPRRSYVRIGGPTVLLFLIGAAFSGMVQNDLLDGTKWTEEPFSIIVAAVGGGGLLSFTFVGIVVTTFWWIRGCGWTMNRA